MADQAIDSSFDLTFRTALKRLDAEELLLKVKDEVHWDLEMTSLLFQRPDQAMIFKRLKEYEGIPIVGNILGSEKNVETIFQRDGKGIRQQVMDGFTKPVAPRKIKEGPVQEVFHQKPDLAKILPLPRYAPEDGGRYISGGVVIAKEAENGIYNASYHRFMLLEENRMLIRLDLGRHLRTLWERAKAKGESLPIAVVLGPDIGTLYAAAMTGAMVPMDMDEYHVASGICHHPIPLIDCQTIPLQVPAASEFVLEGTISPDQEMSEGPFMDFCGLYSAIEPSPLVEVNCLYHRRNPIWHVIMGMEVPMLRKHAFEGAILKAVKAAVPCVTDVALTPGGLYRFHLVIQVKKSSPVDEGYQRNAIYAALGAVRDVDLVIAVDYDINIHNPLDVEWAVAMRWEGSRGLILMPGSRGNEMATISDGGVRTKVGMDATLPYGFSKRNKRVSVPPVDMSKYRTELKPEGEPTGRRKLQRAAKGKRE